MAGLEPVVAFWTGWGIHFMVLLSFTVQVTLLLLADIRRRRDWAWLKVVIWSAYMLADTAAIYALGHMSVLCNWSPEHQLMALWAPLLLVHLGGQDNITAYAIEDNRLWLRHLQTSVVQVVAAVYVLYVSSILSHPMSSNVSWAAILMFVVGVLKYGERIWALNRGNSCASSSLSATSYDKAALVSRIAGLSNLARAINGKNRRLMVAYSLLDLPKKMFEGPTTYVPISNMDMIHEAMSMLLVADMQLSMMYDLLYTKAAVVHTWCGLCSRVLITLPFTVTALALLFYSSLSHGDKDSAGRYYYKRVDVAVTIVLLVGAVVLETISVLRAIFSKWTVVLLYRRGWNTIGDVVFSVIVFVTSAMERIVGTSYWSERMGQHNFFKLTFHAGRSRGSKMAKRVGLEDWWDSNVYSWSTEVPALAVTKVLEQLSKTTEDITKSQGLNALRRGLNNNEDLITPIWKMMGELKLEDRILVWHIATHVYIQWCQPYGSHMWEVGDTVEVLANYMFFLLAARPYMLPYPVSRQAYVQLCSDAVTRLPRDCTESTLLEAILRQHKALMEGTPLGLDKGIGAQRNNTGTDGAEPQPSMNSTLDRGCQLAAKLIHITATETKRVDGKDIIVRKKANGKGIIIAEQAESTGNGKDIMEQAETTFSVNGEVILDMLLEVWVEMLCYTAYLCNEKSHAKHLTDGGEIMTMITLLMIYVKNGLIREGKTITSGRTTAGPSSSQGA